MPSVTHRVEIELFPSQPFRLDLTALALVRRPNNRVDVWHDGLYRRVVPVGDAGPGAEQRPVLLEVRSAAKAVGAPFDERLSVTVVGEHPEDELALAGARLTTELFGLDVDLREFYALAAADERLAPVVGRLKGLKPPRYPGLFQALLNAVPCQQVTLVLGLELLARLSRRFGPELTFAPPDSPAGPLPLPTAEALAGADPDELGALGFSRAKARTLGELARRVVAGELDLAALALADNEEVARELQALYGIGRWTSDYVLLRGLGRLDIFPYGDSGARNVAPWQPYAGLVYLHLLVRGMLERGGFG